MSLISIHNHLVDYWEPLALTSAVLPLAVGALQFELTLFKLLMAVPHLLIDDIQLGLDAYTAESVPAFQSKRLSLGTVD